MSVSVSVRVMVRVRVRVSVSVSESVSEGESERETERKRKRERERESKSKRAHGAEKMAGRLQSVVSYVSGGKWDGPKWEQELGKRRREREQGEIYGACQLLFPHGTIRKLFQYQQGTTGC